jgi:hypothetical protein
LNKAPASTHLLVQLIEPLQFFVRPVTAVDVGVDKINPLFPAFDLSSIEAASPEFLGNSLPPLGGKLRVELRDELNFLAGRRVTSLDQALFLFVLIINKTYVNT